MPLRRDEAALAFVRVVFEEYTAATAYQRPFDISRRTPSIQIHKRIRPKTSTVFWLHEPSLYIGKMKETTRRKRDGTRKK